MSHLDSSNRTSLCVCDCRSARGFMHMRIQRTSSAASVGQSFILGQFSKPFPTVPAMIHHYTLNRLPIRGAEHMCLLRPICEQLL